MIAKNTMIEKEIKMKTKKVVFCLLAVVVLGGCFPFSLLSSLHPLYTDDTIVFEERLVGKWVDGDVIWQFNRDGENAYKLRIVDDNSKEGYFNAHLVQLENMLFLDVFPDGKTLEDVQPFYAIHLFPMHTFIKVEQTEPNLVLRMMDIEKVHEILERDPNLLKHEMVQDGNDKNLVLTASTEDLQRFVVMQFASAEDANAEDVFGDAMVFSRHEPLYTDEDVIFDERLIGEWEGKGGEILDSIQMGEKAYDIIFTEGDGEEHQEVFANLVKIKDMTFLGIFFNKSWFEDKDSNGLHLIPDLFMKVDQIEPKLLLREIRYEEIVELLKDGPEPPEQESQKADYAFEGFRVQL
jgi:hypothetical protein